jgi:hypothetical protein
MPRNQFSKHECSRKRIVENRRNYMRVRWLRILLPILLGILLPAQAVMAAAPTPERRLGLNCEAGVCTAKFDLGVDGNGLAEGVWLSVLQSAVNALPGGDGFVVNDDVSVSLPSGRLTLADAELVVTLDEAGQVATLRGSALAPVPTFALLDGLSFVTPARVTVGFDRGDVLALSHLTLDEARRYLFIDAQAGLSVATQGMALDTAAGQRATLVIDPTQPAVYVDGRVTLRTQGAMAFWGEFAPDASEAGWLPALLPFANSTTLHAQVGRDVEPIVEVNNRFSVDGGLLGGLAGGLVGQWLQLDETPFTTEGWAKISPDGLLVAGEARVAVAPTQVLESHAEAELFVPFDGAEAAYVALSADVASPLLQVDEALATQVVGEPGWVAQTAASTWRGVRDSVAHNVAQSGAAIGTGYAWVEAGTAAQWASVQRGWCGWTGCEAAAGDAGVRVAEVRE